MPTTTKTSRTYWVTPALGVAVGLIYLIGFSVGGKPGYGLIALGIMVVFSAGIAPQVLAFFSGRDTAQVAPFRELTEREREILDLVARGLTNGAIAGRLFLSEKTVRNHVSNVVTKLQVSGRAEAVARARDAGLGAAPV